MNNTTKIGIGFGVAVVLLVGVAFTVMHKPSSSTAIPYATSTATPSPSVVAAAPTVSATPTAQAPSHANFAVVGGTNGASCDSGGYFKPSSISLSSGDTVTFSVPADDPYSGGIQINGLPGGSFVVPRGGSKTTAPITAAASFHGTWPNSPTCLKGSGTITLK